jgi:hypothetical protein
MTRFYVHYNTTIRTYLAGIRIGREKEALRGSKEGAGLQKKKTFRNLRKQISTKPVWIAKLASLLLCRSDQLRGLIEVNSALLQ